MSIIKAVNKTKIKQNKEPIAECFGIYQGSAGEVSHVHARKIGVFSRCQAAVPKSYGPKREDDWNQLFW
jgi:hypothetical protein